MRIEWIQSRYGSGISMKVFICKYVFLILFILKVFFNIPSRYKLLKEFMTIIYINSLLSTFCFRMWTIMSWIWNEGGWKSPNPVPQIQKAAKTSNIEITNASVTNPSIKKIKLSDSNTANSFSHSWTRLIPYPNQGKQLLLLKR